mgnify:FL=1
MEKSGVLVLIDLKLYGDNIFKSLFKIWRNARQAQIFSLGKAI